MYVITYPYLNSSEEDAYSKGICHFIKIRANTNSAKRRRILLFRNCALTLLFYLSRFLSIASLLAHIGGCVPSYSSFDARDPLAIHLQFLRVREYHNR